MEPFLAVFKHYRLAVHKQIATESFHQVPSAAEPIRSLYFDAEDLAYWTHVTEKPTDTTISMAELSVLRDGIRSRAAYDAEDLLPFVEGIEGRSFSELIQSSLEVIQRARNREELGWCGFLENWSIEFFPFLADAFPNSKFVVVVRDPRAVIASALAAPRELRSTFLSYMRSIRKLLDMTLHFSADSRFAGRLCVVKHEALVANPAQISAEICTFLGEDYDSRMIDPSNHVVPGSSQLRDGVSSFEAHATGYDLRRTIRWKSVLEPEIIGLIHGCMGPELELFGYLRQGEAAQLTWPVVGRALQNPRLEVAAPKWSIDMPSLAADYGAEILRSQWLSLPLMEAGGLVDQVRRECFLSDTVAELIRANACDGAVLPAWRNFDHVIAL